MKYLWIILSVIVILLVIVFILLFNKKTLKKIENIKYFYFGYSNGYEANSNVSYSINCKDKCIATIKPNEVSEKDATIVELNRKKLKELEEILNKWEINKWDNFHKSDSNVLDGDGFSLSIRMEDKTSISASGYMMWPKNYSKVAGELDSFFEKLIY